MSRYERLRQEVWQANKEIVRAGLVVLTWGNAGGADREAGVFAIKPSGVSYDDMQPEDMVVVSIETGEVVEGKLKPSSDTPTHLTLYRSFPAVGGIVHTHSINATAWAQACKEIPCYGTTHADHFFGPVPIARQLTGDEIETAYEEHSGRVIVQRFQGSGLDPMHVPGVLLPHHGPFTWGKTPADAVKNAVALEAIAEMALNTEEVWPDAEPAPEVQLTKHFMRKHGPDAYYGQG
jgi:L-ribulose-5-phosphate 4-epimerase